MTTEEKNPGPMTPERAILVVTSEAEEVRQAMEIIEEANQRAGVRPVPGQRRVFDDLRVRERELRQIVDLLASTPPKAPTPRMFPLQAGYRDAKAAPHPLQIPWSVAEKAHCAYVRSYGTRQSLERLAERGGFDGAEMDMLYPAWREEVSELASLRAKLAEAENSRDTARGVANAFRDTISRATGNPDAVHGLMILCQSHEKLAEWEAAGRVLADSVWRFCGNAECYRHCDAVQTGGGCTCGEEKILDEIMAPVESNPLASRLVAEAGGKQ